MEAKFSKYKHLFEDEKQKNDVANETLAKFIHCMTLLYNKYGSENVTLGN